ncbi:ABC-2 type transport system permease protein [Arcanobacterium wilhelmae]|uniref:ABC-2 type transport system permease protein n=1 Tax=Arcanobacterium wilhelmae TaxID=1803177 RepID=A0ABT9NC10_9ACTO|nr:ABC transporter permease [Arcanobacterium wilhelmae]MDP9801247.1 ABC-2 type transport system permease protein [Arcanobacterium wilhelmae]WFN90594.1 hypothetical protein P8A24_01680 [Arcanobacterium wilhelmae]
MNTMATQYTSRFANRRVNFLGTVRSELKKLMIRSILITSFVGLLIVAGLSLVVASAQMNDRGSAVQPEGVLILWSISGLVMIVVGTLAVTSEYAHNTMRTTALSVAGRGHAYFAKATAVAVYAAVYAVVTAGTQIGVATARLGSQADFTATTWFTAGRFVGVLVCFALIALGLGYILRSTAGAIAVVMVFFIFGGMVALVPVEWIMKNIPQFMPQSVGTLALANEAVPPLMGGPLLDNAAKAFAALGVYVAVALGSGLALFKARDI